MNNENKIKLKIVSDGTSEGTNVVTEDGKRISGIQKLVWMADANQEFTYAVLEIIDIPIIGKVEEAELQKISELIKEQNDENKDIRDNSENA
jgi:hypothetical protein